MSNPDWRDLIRKAREIRESPPDPEAIHEQERIDYERSIRLLRRATKQGVRVFEQLGSSYDPIRVLRQERVARKEVRKAILALWSKHGYMSHDRMRELVGRSFGMTPNTYARLKREWLSERLDT